MNRKTIFTFLLGFITSSLLFGIICLAQRSNTQKTVSPTMISEPLPKLIPPTSAASKQTVESPVRAAGLMKPQAPSPILSMETAAFKSFISSTPDVHSVIHEVKTGDTLTSISRKYHITVDLARKINHIQQDKLILGTKLKIPTYKLSIVVDKSQNTLILKGDEEILKTYTVSTGTNNSTPIGVFKITDKLIHPTWYKSDGKVIPYGDPANLLGSRWMGISKKGYGIHGTLEPEKLGQQITDGCIRMKNEEVDELYGFLTPGTEVTIVD